MTRLDPANPFNAETRLHMNDLPESLFVNIELEEGMFGVGAKYSYVCPDHNGRRLPCRTCIYREVATTPYMLLRKYRAQLLYDGFQAAQPFDWADGWDTFANYLAERNF